MDDLVTDYIHFLISTRLLLLVYYEILLLHECIEFLNRAHFLFHFLSFLLILNL